MKELLNRVTQQLKQVENDSPIPTGNDTKISIEQKTAINQIFELFRFNYHNQFLKAFPDLDTLIMAKQLWGRLLTDYVPKVIMASAEQVVKNQKFLPNVHDIIEACQSLSSRYLGLPNPRSAYIEACRAPQPKVNYDWSHTAVYYAGKASDWYFLSTEAEQIAYPVFERNYAILVDRVCSGEVLSIDVPQALPEKSIRPLPVNEQKKHMKELMFTCYEQEKK
jgi:hypothetical protein